MTPAPGYREWSRLLADRFFSSDRSGSAVYFAVDDEILDELAGATAPGQGAQALTDGLRPMLRMREPRQLFDDCADDAYSWAGRNYSGPPPMLPCLAACVLAASRMAAEEGISSANYYTRLRQLLEVDAPLNEAYTAVIPPLFRLLAEWLDTVQQGKVGLSSFPAEPSPAHIGYALSQALLRESDRRKLTRFFRATRLSAADASAAPQLVDALRRWSGLPGLSRGARHFIASDQYRDQLAELLRAELSVWDGAEVDSEGRRIAAMRLTLALRPRPEFGLACEKPALFPERAAFRGGDIEVEFSSLDDRWYAPVGLEVLGPGGLQRILAEGLTMSAGRFSARYTAAEVAPLGPEPSLGMLATRTRTEPGTRHWVLAAAALAQGVGEHLGRWAREGWRRTDGAPDGWVLFRDVFFDLPPVEEVAEELRPLIPSVASVPVFAGGLPLTAAGPSRTYLVGGEPDLWLPEWSFSDGAPPDVLVDAESTRASHAAGGAVLRLAALSLPAGAHSVAAAGFRLRLQTVSQAAERRDGLVCSVLRSCRTGEPPRGDSGGGAVVCGATLTGAVSEGDDWPVLLPHGIRGYSLIGSVPGEVAEGRPDPRPAWLGAAGLFTQDFEIYLAFEPAWAVLAWPNLGVEVRRLSGTAVRMADEAHDPVAGLKWASIVLSAADDNAPDLQGESWAGYVAAAKALAA